LSLAEVEKFRDQAREIVVAMEAVL
jgi:hypothetical protein